MIISKINTEIETFCIDSDFRQSYPLIVFWGRGYDLDTQPCLFVPLFCLLSKTETIKKVLQYVDIVGLVSFLSPFGFVLMWSAWDSPKRVTKLIFKTLYFLLQAYPMIYPTNLLRAFAVVCSWRILRAKIRIFSLLYYYATTVYLQIIYLNNKWLYDMILKRVMV